MLHLRVTASSLLLLLIFTQLGAEKECESQDYIDRVNESICKYDDPVAHVEPCLDNVTNKTRMLLRKCKTEVANPDNFLMPQICEDKCILEKYNCCVIGEMENEPKETLMEYMDIVDCVFYKDAIAVTVPEDSSLLSRSMKKIKLESDEDIPHKSDEEEQKDKSENK